MLRWHSTRCRKPDVILLDNIPYCVYCEETSNLHSTQGSIVSNSEPLHTPPLKLRWPTCVAYSDENESTQTKQETVGINPSDQSRTEHDQHQPPEFPKTKRARAYQIQEPFEEAVGYCGLNQMYDFRLLHLSQHLTAGPLHGDLELVDLADITKPYEALSYTWADEDGNTDRCEVLYLGPYWDCLPITRNCYLALQRFREVRSWTVWVDAICINQNNNSERSHQVNIMREIYSKAESVVVFLGPPNEDIIKALEALTMTACLSKNDQAYDTDNRYVPLLRSAGPSIMKLFCMRYFSRVWIIQEIAVAQRVIMVCGNTFALLHMTDLLAIPHLISQKVPEWLLRYSRKNSSINHRAEELLNLLNFTSHSSASDARDQVFAVLGLISGARINGLVPDYSLSLEQVHTGIAAYLLLKQRMLDILAYPRPKIRRMATWVPDWAADRHLKFGSDADLNSDLSQLTYGELTERNYGGQTLWLNGHDTIGILFQSSIDDNSPRVLIKHCGGCSGPRSNAYGHPKVYSKDGALSITTWRITKMRGFSFARSKVYIRQPSSSVDFKWVIETEIEVNFDLDEIMYIPGCKSYLHMRKVYDDCRYELIGSCKIGLQSSYLRREIYIHNNRNSAYSSFNGMPHMIETLEYSSIDHKMMAIFFGVDYSLLGHIEEMFLENDFCLMVHCQLANSKPISKPTGSRAAMQLDRQELREFLFSDNSDSCWNTGQGWKLLCMKTNLVPNMDLDKGFQLLNILFDQSTWEMMDIVHSCLLELQSMKIIWNTWLHLQQSLILDLGGYPHTVGTPTADFVRRVEMSQNKDQLHLTSTREAWRNATRVLLRQLQSTQRIFSDNLHAKENIPISSDTLIDATIDQWLQDDICASHELNNKLSPNLCSDDFRTVIHSRILFFESMESSWQDFIQRSQGLRQICEHMSIFRSFREEVTPMGDILIV
ncbi:heterokaryon incompatibility protein-domain-containing protein [Xylaria scruposa]|nr:heterokaryon incompatibility protein-domain-containing protein [Xylaria scruposa]